MNFILIFICIAAGVILSRLKLLPENAHKGVNAWVLYVAIPALALRFIPSIEWSYHILVSILGPIVVWVGAWLFVQIYDRKRKLPIGSRIALLVTCGLGNTSFIGFPLISAFYGESEIKHAVLFDQTTFLLFSTVCVIAIMKASYSGGDRVEGGGVNAGDIIKKVFTFPPLVACIAALILPLFIDISPINPFLDKLVATVSPMALFSIGLQLKLKGIKQEWRLITAGLTYKLILAPALVFLLVLAMGTTGNLARITIFEASMSSHITASLLASQYNMNPRYCSLIVGVGILASLITSTCWFLIGEVGK